MASAASGKTSPYHANQSQTFRSITAVIVWWLWVLFALGNLIDLAVQGRDRLALVAAGVLLLVTGIAYVTALRPRVIASAEGIAILNPLRDHRVPWALVEEVDLASLLRVHYRATATRTGIGAATRTGAATGRTEVISAWAVPYSRRRQMTSELRARRRLGRAARDADYRPFGVPDPGYRARSGISADTSAEADAVRIARLLNDRAATGQATAPNQASTGTPTQAPAEGQRADSVRPTNTWSWPAIAALAVPALFLLLVVLV